MGSNSTNYLFRSFRRRKVHFKLESSCGWVKDLLSVGQDDQMELCQDKFVDSAVSFNLVINFVIFTLELKTGSAICSDEERIIMMPAEGGEKFCTLIKLDLSLSNLVIENCSVFIDSRSVSFLNFVDVDSSFGQNSKHFIVIWIEN